MKKPCVNAGFLAVRLGVMPTRRNRSKQPAYLPLLRAFRLTGTETPQVYWNRVCTDRLVIGLSMALAAKKKVGLPSVTEPYNNAARVLAVMTARQLADLRQRIGAAVTRGLHQ